MIPKSSGYSTGDAYREGLIDGFDRAIEVLYNYDTKNLTAFNRQFLKDLVSKMRDAQGSI